MTEGGTGGSAAVIVAFSSHAEKSRSQERGRRQRSSAANEVRGLDPELLHWIPVIPSPVHEGGRARICPRRTRPRHAVRRHRRGSRDRLDRDAGQRAEHWRHRLLVRARGSRPRRHRALRLLCRHALDELKLERLRARHRHRERGLAAGRGEGRLSAGGDLAIAPAPSGRTAPRLRHVLAPSGRAAVARPRDT